MVHSLLLGALFCFAFLMIVRYLFFVAVIEGESMCPAFEPGEKALVLRYWPVRWLPHNAVIVTHLTSELAASPPILAVEKASELRMEAVAERTVIKRVVGLPGEMVHTMFPSKRDWRIPPEHYFVRSDGFGVDSDMLGPIPFDCFQGLVLTKFVIGKKSCRSTRKVKNAG